MRLVVCWAISSIHVPQGTDVRTGLSGPQCKKAIKDLDWGFDTRCISLLANGHKSIGNFIVDLDCKLLLDIHAQLLLASSSEVSSSIMNRPALGNIPQHDWPLLFKVSLEGPNQGFTATAELDAKWDSIQGGVYVTKSSKSSPMNKQRPGSAELSIQSFESGFYGGIFFSFFFCGSHSISVPVVNLCL